MAAIDKLLEQVSDASLRERLKEEIEHLTQNKKFGLVFEEHLPECTPLYGVPIKRGATVAKKASKINDTYTVIKLNKESAICRNKKSGETEEIATDELVSVSEFGEPIFPCLTPIDRVENAPDSNLWHTLIQADNYHALQLLEYLYAGKVDCIYIDPPYNTGAKDWKYNNDYVDGSDSYRHSKWLSFIQRRLKLAKRLLNPDDGILMVAIDDNELNTLGMLIHEIFNGWKVFCITIVHNPNGNQGKNFGIQNEFVYFVMPNGNQLLALENRTDSPDIRPLRDVSGNNNMRTDAKNCFYPIYVKEGKIVGFGEVCEDDFHPASANVVGKDGVLEIYPIDASGKEKKWVFARQTVESIVDELCIEWNSSREIYDVIRHKTHFTYKSVWHKKEYNANSYGSKLINAILGPKRFDYPKSLYAVAECIRAVCGERKNALILDFFAGSGTTLHAVNLLNAEDGGHRRCIMVTNNEVSAEEARNLTAQGYKPGDEEWEKLGIARYVTWPRTVCSIEGHDVNGNPLTGNYGCEQEEYTEVEGDVTDPETGRKIRGKVYKKTKKPAYPKLAEIKMSDGFAANCEYFKLDFLDRDMVSLGTQFQEILPLLWLKAGAVGRRSEVTDEEPKMLVLPQNRFAVLVEEAYFAEFARQVEECGNIDTVYFVTNSEQAFREMSAGINVENTHQLYREYIDNFVIGARRDAK